MVAEEKWYQEHLFEDGERELEQNCNDRKMDYIAAI